jgi:hypothetical protein
MSVSSINYASSLLGQSVRNINDQLTDLSTQLSTGVKSTTYAGMGVNEGFAVAARAQLANIGAFTDTMTNLTNVIDATNTALTSFTALSKQVQSAASSDGAVVNGSGQTTGQQTAVLQLKSMLEILNTQAGNRYLFSGSGIDKPAVVSLDDILNGNGTAAGLKQLIAERNQADLGATGMGRLVISQPAPTSVSVAEDVAGSPFGFKLNGITSALTGATVTGPTGSPPSMSVTLGATNPNNGDLVTFTFNLPDGTTEQVQLTASTTNPPPAGSFAIGATPAATAANLNTALTNVVSTLANTSLVAASAMAASDNFFNWSVLTTGSAVNSKLAAPMTGATLLSGAGATDSLTTNFAAGDTLTVNGTTITFVAAGATGNQLNVTDSVQTLLAKIDSITGTPTPSSVNGGAITLQGGNASDLSITSSNTAALSALGLGTSVSVPRAPLRVAGPPFNSATALVGGTPANTVYWYTGENAASPARTTLIARVDQAATIQYGVRASEQAIRSTLESIGAFAALTTSPTSANATAVISALNQRVATSLTPQGTQQSVADIQTDLATAQLAMKDATSRQTQAKMTLQNLVDQTESISTDQVASEILALQTRLQASYQATSMLAQLSLVKYLPVG